jgi:hypothetical protein
MKGKDYKFTGYFPDQEDIDAKYQIILDVQSWIEKLEKSGTLSRMNDAEFIISATFNRTCDWMVKKNLETKDEKIQ